MNKTKVITAGAAIVLVVATTAWRAYSHCQIPCGIYDDEARFAAIAEHIGTIGKSMRKIEELGAAKKPNYNQLIRWVTNKEHHADLIGRIVTQYFMAQRIKSANPADGKAYAQYIKTLTLLHRMLVTAMKAKQTTDIQYATQLDKLLDEFREAYSGEDRPAKTSPEKKPKLKSIRRSYR